MWILIELFFFLNLTIIALPFKIRVKKFWSIIIMSVLTSWLLFFILFPSAANFLLNLSQFSMINFKFILFNQPILFILDELSSIFCFLTCLISLFVIILNWKNPSYHSSFYLFIIWIIQFSLFHTFSSFNLISFYIFFEISLFPMFLFILIWGSRQRKVYSAYLFFFYTAVGSFFLLLGLFYLYFLTNTFLLSNLSYLKLPINSQFLLWIFFFFGFATKIPLVPLHTWLPEAHVEAPTPGSMILAGLLLKIGTFGMLRFMFPLLIEVNIFCRPFAFLMALISIYHASFIALRQVDFKKIIAYSSISHMGFVILGLFSMNLYGLLGSLFIMFSHGIVASTLFFLVGILYDRYKVRNILYYGGLTNVMPIFVVVFFFFILANLSFPGTSNFVGELIVLFGLIEINFFTTILSTFSIIFTAIYSIWFFNRISFGPLNPSLSGFSDLNKIEFLVCLIFFIFLIAFGFKPDLILSNVEIELFKFLIKVN